MISRQLVATHTKALRDINRFLVGDGTSWPLQCACTSERMKVILLAAALIALVSVPWLQAVWLGRLDPKQVTTFLGSRS